MQFGEAIRAILSFPENSKETTPANPIVPHRPTTDDTPKSASMLALSKLSSVLQSFTRLGKRSNDAESDAPDEAASVDARQQSAH